MNYSHVLFCELDEGAFNICEPLGSHPSKSRGAAASTSCFCFGMKPYFFLSRTCSVETRITSRLPRDEPTPRTLHQPPQPLCLVVFPFQWKGPLKKSFCSTNPNVVHCLRFNWYATSRLPSKVRISLLPLLQIYSCKIYICYIPAEYRQSFRVIHLFQVLTPPP